MLWSSLAGDDPWPMRPGWLMSDMLGVSTGQVCDPITHSVLLKPNKGLVHSFHHAATIARYGSHGLRQLLCLMQATQEWSRDHSWVAVDVGAGAAAPAGTPATAGCLITAPCGDTLRCPAARGCSRPRTRCAVRGNLTSKHARRCVPKSRARPACACSVCGGVGSTRRPTLRRLHSPQIIRHIPALLDCANRRCCTRGGSPVAVRARACRNLLQKPELWQAVCAIVIPRARGREAVMAAAHLCVPE